MVKKLKVKSKEKKLKKKEKPIHIKQRDFLSKKSNQQSKLVKNNFEENNQSTIEQLINSLDGPHIKTSMIDKDANFKVGFPSDIDDTKFKELFKNAINYAKLIFDEYNLKVLKTILLVLKDINGKNSNDDFGLKSCFNGLQKVYRKDLIFTLLSNKNKVEDFANSNQIEYEFKQSIDYEIYINNHAFKNALFYNVNNNKNELFPFNLFKNIIFSPIILKAYKEVLYELYNIQTPKNEIKNIIENFLKNHNIYFLPMHPRRYGMTFYDGTIVINRIYYGIAYTEEYAFIILWTLLHEIMNILSRLKRSDNNIFIDTSKFKMAKKIFSEESGNYFRNKLLSSIHKKKCLTFVEAEYLLKKESYAYKTLKEFQKAFNNFRKLNESKIKRSQSFAIEKETNDKTFSIKIGCYCAGERKND